MKIIITIHFFPDQSDQLTKTIELNLKPTNSILNIKEKIKEKEGFPVEYQRLVFGCKSLGENDYLIRDYSIKEGSVIHLVASHAFTKKN